MKIALVCPYDMAYPGGVGIHISRLEENFIRMGHEVTIIAPSSKPRETLQNGDVIVLGRPVPIRASGSIVRVPVSPLLLFSGRIPDILNREKFDVIHIHEPLLPVLATSVLHYTSQELAVGTFHAYRNNSWGYPFWKPIILNRWFNKLDGRIAVSNAAKGFVNQYFPAEYTIIPNGIDLQHFKNHTEPLEQYCDDKLNILFVGRMEKRKGFKYLLGAYEQVKREFPHCRLIVVGPKDRSWQKYRRLAIARNLQDIVFAGFASYDDLPRYYRSADIFCSPATGKESFGLVLLEAMAAGKPIIASNIAGYADVVSHGVDGLLVKPQDTRALADGLLQLLRDKPLRERMGAMGELKAQDYSWESVAQRVIDYYQELRQDHPQVVSEEIAYAQQGQTRLGPACQ
ncbi:MAG: glycosyltransferase family 4 protein [Chloroflexota bacterium]|nr:glycosyltransferase family 4 protein [Chloroflexota bacterium]